MSETWQEIWETVQADFADLPNLTQTTQVIVRLLLAALLGGLLGFEREHAGKAAGVRTHMLVALGSAFFVLVPAQAGMPMNEMSRVLQGLITGIGFLGAGAIIKSTTQRHIYGLTTAAGIWFTAAVGAAAGLGRDASAVLGTILAFLILAAIPRFGPNA
jgi:putative Mg2+ transporter-C (MgtC) family protein